MKPVLPLLLIAVAACNQAAPVTDGEQDTSPTPSAGVPATGANSPSVTGAPKTTAPAASAAVSLPGLNPDDRTPVSEANFTATSAQGAANTVQTYFALIEGQKFEAAWRLRDLTGDETPKQLKDAIGRYREYHAQVGSPGRIEGAAGSVFVVVPVKIYGVGASGMAFERGGLITLRRSNDVPGTTATQREWRIVSAEPANLLR